MRELSPQSLKYDDTISLRRDIVKVTRTVTSGDFRNDIFIAQR